LGKAFPSLPAGNRGLEFTSGRQGKVTPNSLRITRGIALQKRFFKLRRLSIRIWRSGLTDALTGVFFICYPFCRNVPASGFRRFSHPN
jgi:hypothetical protein